MFFEAVSLSIIALLLFILLLSRKNGNLKLLLGILTAAASIAAMVSFILMQKESGNPDVGKEFIQLYLPCAVYLSMALWSILTALAIYRKKKRERDAKRALKNAKKHHPAEE